MGLHYYLIYLLQNLIVITPKIFHATDMRRLSNIYQSIHHTSLWEINHFENVSNLKSWKLGMVNMMWTAGKRSDFYQFADEIDLGQPKSDTDIILFVFLFLFFFFTLFSSPPITNHQEEAKQKENKQKALEDNVHNNRWQWWEGGEWGRRSPVRGFKTNHVENCEKHYRILTSL